MVANPISGRGQAQRAAREASEGLRSQGLRTELFFTEGRGSAFEKLRRSEEDLELVVSVGGDGTLREVFDGLVDPAIPVGVLPFGTGNILARQWRLPRDVHRALEIFRRRNVAALDVSRVNGKLSFLVTGIGIDAEAIREVERHRRGPIRKASYVTALARALARHRPPELEIELDGEPVAQGSGSCLVTHAASYAGLLKLATDARPDDGLFEVYLFPRGTRLELLAGGLRALWSPLPTGSVRMFRGSRLTVRSKGEVPYQIDGDLGGTTPVEVTVDPNRYHLVVP